VLTSGVETLESEMAANLVQCRGSPSGAQLRFDEGQNFGLAVG
jgi:hypothetical protein